MRTVTQTLQDAFERQGTYKIVTKLSIEPTRVYFDSNDITDNSPTWAPAAGMSDTPIPQDIIVSNSKVLTVYTKDADLKYMWSDSDIERSLSIATDNFSKVGIVSDKLFYVESSGNLKRSSWSAVSDVITLSGTETIATGISNASVCAISTTECVSFWLDQGGIRATYCYFDSTWQSHETDYRFMVPDALITDPYRTNFCASVKFNGDIFVYCSMPSGIVKGCKFDGTLEKWGNLFDAVQADLSIFSISNAIVSNNKIHLCGQFSRTEELDTGSVTNMVLDSLDGEVFAIERLSLVATTGDRWLIAQDQSTLYFAASNKSCSVAAPKGYDDTPDALEIDQDDIITLELTDELASSEMFCDIKNGDEQYKGHALLKKGNLITIEVGYKTSAGNEMVLGGTYILDEIHSSNTDGERTLEISATHTGIWHIDRIASPFYYEIIGKSFVYDDVDELDNLYVAPNTGMFTGVAAFDFWDCAPFEPDGTVTGIDIIGEYGGPEPYHAVASHKLGIKTADFGNSIVGNRPVATGDPVMLSVYGWCKTSVSAHSPDTISAYLIIDREIDSATGETEEQTLLYDSLLTTSSWPLKFVDEVTGSYPIQYQFNLNEGDIIKRVGLVFQAANDTIFLPERVDIEGAGYSRDSSYSNTSWEVVDDGLQIPGAARPYVMLSTRPYSSFEFSVFATFSRSIGAVPNTSHTYSGVIGLAKDGANYLAARYCWQTSHIEIISVRHNLVKVLAYTTLPIVSDNTISIAFVHKGGKLMVHAKVDDTWGTSVLEYDWQSSDGAMSTSSTGIMHVGIYGEIDLPKFHTLYYYPDKSDGIAISPDSYLYALDEFPYSGKVQIGENVYSYYGKSSNRINNPFYGPGRTLGPYSGVKEDYSGLDDEIDDWNEDDPGISSRFFNLRSSEPEGESGYLDKRHIISANGENRLLGDDTNIAARWMTDRSRFMSSSYGQYVFIDNGTKIYISMGLMELELLIGDESNIEEGELCHIYTTETLMLSEFGATNLSKNVTVRDMLRFVCASVGADAQFSGDTTGNVQASASGESI
jgi:hypothetical protein